MTQQVIRDLLGAHAFFGSLSDGHIDTLSECGREIQFETGEYLGREGDQADCCYAICTGQVAIETFVPHEGAVKVQTLSAGNVAGWSWVVPPHRWMFDARATEAVRCIALDADCLRRKCEQDPQLGYWLMKALVEEITRRFQATRIQLLDLYGRRPG